MPCTLSVKLNTVIDIILSLDNLEYAKKALVELELKENIDYSFSGALIKLISKKAISLEGQIRQRYGIIKSEREARLKGYKTQRVKQLDNVIQLVLTK